MTWLDGVGLDRRVDFPGLAQREVVRRKVEYWRARGIANVVGTSEGVDGGAEPSTNCGREHSMERERA